MKKIIAILMLLVSTTSHAWDYSDDVKIEALFQWETEAVQHVMIILTNGKKCHLNGTDDKLYSLVLGLYMSEKSFGIHCYEETENIGGFHSQKIHRIGAKQN